MEDMQGQQAGCVVCGGLLYRYLVCGVVICAAPGCMLAHKQACAACRDQGGSDPLDY